MESGDTLRKDREARFIEGVGAFIRRDLEALARTMRPDVTMRLPGGSWLAGTYHGPEEVGRCILALRQVLESSEDNVTFVHEDHRMVVGHDIRLHGPSHDIEMTFSISMDYDADERVTTIEVHPADPGLFDHVVQTSLLAFDASRFA
jgi:ketosteroid isomerase-like protein